MDQQIIRDQNKFWRHDELYLFRIIMWRCKIKEEEKKGSGITNQVNQ